MGRGRTKVVLTTRIDAAQTDATRATRGPDELLVEEPLSIQIDGRPVATTMRTPGHDFELAVGFCHAEGLLDGIEVSTVRYCGTGSAAETEFNVVTVDTRNTAPDPVARLGTVGSACGTCGAESIDALRERLRPLPPGRRPSLAVLSGVPDRVRVAQALFSATGAAHAAAAFEIDGDLIEVREDIGRHNAVDKVVGRLRLDDELPAHDRGLFVSGRASFEMVQKAWAAGFGAVVAVSAPSALAVATAEAAGMTLVGFARGGQLNVYSGDPQDAV